MTLRIAHVEDHAGYRASLAEAVDRVDGIELCGGWDRAESALRAAREHPPEAPPWDVLLMDLDLPGMHGTEAITAFKALWPSLQVVVLTVFDDPPVIVRAISAGADGYLLKGARIEELLEQLRVLSDGGAAMSPSVARCVLGLLRESRPRLLRPPPPVALTQRQKEVLACLADGMSYERIADEMQISVNTVRTHVRRLYDALQVEGAAEAVSKAFRHRLL